MTNLTIETVNKKTTGKIEDVVFAYIKLQEGSYKYQSKTEKEYTVDVVVNKATAKEFKKQFPKNLPKEFDNEEFKTKFKIDPVYPDQEEQYTIKFKAAAQLKSDYLKGGLKEGDAIPYEWPSRPKLFVPVEGGVQDVTMTVLAANGSRGTVAFNVTSNDFGTFPQLTGVLVTDLIEYEGAGGASSAFGAVVGGYNADTSRAQQAASAGQSTEDTTSDSELSGETSAQNVQDNSDDEPLF